MGTKTPYRPFSRPEPTTAAPFFRRTRPLFLLGLAAVAFLTAILSLAVSGIGRQHDNTWLNGFDKECRHWNPTEPSTDGRCRAAKRLREVQAFLRDTRYEYDDHTMERVRQLEACALGLVDCPPRPLVVSLWTGPPLTDALSQQLEQEEERAWRREMAEVVEKFNYVYIADSHRARLLHLIRSLRLNLHQVWMDEHSAIECLQNPRCIAPDDYTPPLDPELVANTTPIADGEEGVIGMWQLMVTSWNGARPSNAQPPGSDLTRDWGIDTTPNGNEVWSFNPLGRQHIISPYPYPTHSWIPFTHQHQCAPGTFTRSRPLSPPPDGTVVDRTVVLLGDVDDMNTTHARRIQWDRVHALLLARGLNVTFTIPSSLPPSSSPNSKVSTIPTTPESYPALVTDADALLGIGTPALSAIPYLSLCRGTPVVLPTFAAPKGTVLHWAQFDARSFQHGMFYVHEPEPYAYKYDIGSAEGLARALGKALTVGMEPHTPRPFSALALYEAMEAVLHHDYWGEYSRQIRVDKKTPVLNEGLRAKCWEKGWCRAGLYEDQP